MKINIYYILFFLCLILSIGCRNEARSLKDFKEMDLSESGIPIKIKTPSGTKVEEDTTQRVLKLMEKGLVLKGNHYHIRVEKILKDYENPKLDAREIKEARLSLEQKISHKGEFNKIEQDDPNGFIFTTITQPHGKTWHFFYVAVVGGRQVEFTDYFSVLEKNEEQDIRLMYESVKQGQ